MPKLQRAKTVACGLLRWDRCCIIVVSHWSKPAGQNMASLLVVVGFRTSHSMPKEESHVIFSKNLPLKARWAPPVWRPPEDYSVRQALRSWAFWNLTGGPALRLLAKTDA